MSKRFVAAISAAGVLTLGPGEPAHAGPYTEVTSAFDEGDPFDLHLSVNYQFELSQAVIERERIGQPGTEAGDPIPVVSDLLARQVSHRIVPRLELGLFTNFAFTAALPVVLVQSRRLDLDGTSRDTSPTIGDGLLGAGGFDADNPGGAGFASGDTVFRGATRAGLDQVHLGAVWALMNQANDDTKPTWKLGAEARIAIGEPMTLDRTNPDSATGVGRGVHEVRVWTSVAKRRGWAEPYVELWWQAPFAATSESPFQDRGFGHERTDSQQQAGTRFGFAAALGDRVALDMSGRMTAHFEGWAYTEMWEVFQYAGTNGAGGPLVLDADPVTEGQQALTHPGITYVENYIEMGGRLGLSAVLGKAFRLGAAVEVSGQQSHVLSFADAGSDLPLCTPERTSNCETASDDLVTPGTAEVNPTYAPVIDQTGRRYRLGGSLDMSVFVDARLLF